MLISLCGTAFSLYAGGWVNAKIKNEWVKKGFEFAISFNPYQIKMATKQRFLNLTMEEDKINKAIYFGLKETIKKIKDKEREKTLKYRGTLGNFIIFFNHCLSTAEKQKKPLIGTIELSLNAATKGAYQKQLKGQKGKKTTQAHAKHRYASAKAQHTAARARYKQHWNKPHQHKHKQQYQHKQQHGKPHQKKYQKPLNPVQKKPAPQKPVKKVPQKKIVFKKNVAVGKKSSAHAHKQKKIQQPAKKSGKGIKKNIPAKSAPHGTVNIIQGDIVKQNVQAIVNASNKQFGKNSDLGGVAKAIANAMVGANAQKYEDWRKNVLHKKGELKKCRAIPIGSATIGPAFSLNKGKIKYIIHAVGPDCRKKAENENRVFYLASAYYNALDAADKNNLQSIAFPPISVGIFGCPSDQAAQIAMSVTGYYLNQRPSTSLTRIVFLARPKERQIYQNLFDSVKKESPAKLAARVNKYFQPKKVQKKSIKKQPAKKSAVVKKQSKTTKIAASKKVIKAPQQQKHFVPPISPSGQGGPTKKLIVALDIPATLKFKPVQRLAKKKFEDHFKNNIQKPKLSLGTVIHTTLVYLGPTPTSNIQAIKGALKQTTTDFLKQHDGLKGLYIKKGAKVLSSAVTLRLYNSYTLQGLVETIKQNFDDANITYSTQFEFKPHVSLGFMQPPGFQNSLTPQGIKALELDLQNVDAPVGARHSKHETFTGARMILYKSEKAQLIPLATYKLTH